ADAADADAGDEVDVLVAVLVVERAAGAPRHGQPRVLGEGLEPRRHVASLPFDDPPRSGAGLARLHQRTPRKRRVRWAAMATAASSRESAKIGPALRSTSTRSPAAVAITSPA